MIARIDHDDDGQGFVVRSPAVGVVDAVPRLGLYMNPQEPFLVMRILGRRHVVQLPRDVQGRVAEKLVTGTTVAVEFNQPLFRLRLGAESAEEAQSVAAAGAGAAAGTDMIPVPSPSEGIFYGKPSPDSPAYVEVGSEVTQGTVLGLVEVMKSFNQIKYGGPALPERGIVVKIMVEDSTEVTFGQPLVMIKVDR